MQYTFFPVKPNLHGFGIIRVEAPPTYTEALKVPARKRRGGILCRHRVGISERTSGIPVKCPRNRARNPQTVCYYAPLVYCPTVGGDARREWCCAGASRF
jgi:hypothetical protein